MAVLPLVSVFLVCVFRHQIFKNNIAASWSLF